MSQEETLRLVAELLDKTTGPLKDIQKSLRNTSQIAKQLHGEGGKDVERHSKSYQSLFSGIEKARLEVSGAFTPALAELGLTTLGVGGAIASVVSQLKTFAAQYTVLRDASRRSGQSVDFLEATANTMERLTGANTEEAIQNLANMSEQMNRLTRMRPDTINAWKHAYTGLYETLGKDLMGKTLRQQLDLLMEWKEAHPEIAIDKVREVFHLAGADIGLATVKLTEYREAQAELDAFQKAHPYDTENAKQLHKAFSDLTLMIKGVGWEIRETFGPIATGVIGDFMKTVKSTMTDINNLMKAIDWVGRHLGFRDNSADQKAYDEAQKKRSEEVQKNALPPSQTIPNISGWSPAQKLAAGMQPVSFTTGGGGGGGGPEQMLARGVKIGMLDAFREWFAGGQLPGKGGFSDGFTNASFSPEKGGGAGGGGLGPGGGAGGGLHSGGGYSVLPEGSTGGGAKPGGGDPDGPKPSGGGAAGKGGSGGITAPAGTAIQKEGLATITTKGGKTFKVAASHAKNFQGFINDYEAAGGVIGPDSGTMGARPNNASGHPIGEAIDVNQTGRGVRSRPGRGVSLAPAIEDALAKKWGMVSGNNWRSNDQGHFGIESEKVARAALVANGLIPAEGQTPSAASTAPDGGSDTPITAGKGGAVNPQALNQRLQGLIAKSSLAGMLPADAKKYGFKTGSAKEWAGLMSGIAGQESGNVATAHGDGGKFGGAGSSGLFQLSPQDAVTYGLQKTPFTQAQMNDPDFNARMAVKIAEARVKAGGVGGEGGMSAYWAGKRGFLARGEVQAGVDNDPLKDSPRPRDRTSEDAPQKAGGPGGLTERNLLDHAAKYNRSAPQTVEGNASIALKLDGFPKNTKTDLTYGGLFKEHTIEKGRAMETAESK